MLKVQFIDGINPFSWEHFRCPLCDGNEFISIGQAGVYCDECNAKFSVRDTAGDPGCVVDCFTTEDRGAYVYAPAYQCETCNAGENPLVCKKHARLDWQDKVCPANEKHGPMTVIKGIRTCWKPHVKSLEYFYMILKLGDYCSGWLNSDSMKRGQKRKGPTESQWAAYQATDMGTGDATRVYLDALNSIGAFPPTSNETVEALKQVARDAIAKGVK